MAHHNVQTIIQQVSSWDGITAHPHRFGGVEFNLGQVEVGHIHNHGMVDIPFTVKMRERLVAAGDAEPHHLLADSGWITLYLRADADMDRAMRLYRLSYLLKKYRKPADRASARDLIDGELQSLGFSPDVVAAMSPSRANEEQITPPRSASSTGRGEKHARLSFVPITGLRRRH